MPTGQDFLGGEEAAIGVLGSFFDALREPSTVGEGQKLRAPADRERRERSLSRGRDQGEFPVVGGRVRVIGVLDRGPIDRRDRRRRRR